MDKQIDQKTQAIADILTIPAAVVLLLTLPWFLVPATRASALSLFFNAGDFAIAIFQGIFYFLVLLSPIAIALLLPGFLGKY